MVEVHGNLIYPLCVFTLASPCLSVSTRHYFGTTGRSRLLVCVSIFAGVAANAKPIGFKKGIGRSVYDWSGSVGIWCWADPYELYRSTQTCYD